MEFAPPAYPSASPGFSFSSPAAGSFRRSLASSPTTSSAHYAPSFLDSVSPLLPRRSPRFNNRVLSSSFSPSPSLFNRTLSAYSPSPSPTPSSKRLRGDALYDLAHTLPDDSWAAHIQQQSGQQPSSPTASSQSTPIPSVAGGRDRLEPGPRASSDRAADRSLRTKRERESSADDSDGGEGEAEAEQRDSSVDGGYDEQAELQRDSSAMSTASTASKQHARLSQLQQQLLRAASGADAPKPASKRVKKEDKSSGDDDNLHDRMAEEDHSLPDRDEQWPQSSSASASSTSSHPSLSSLSTTFNTPSTAAARSPARLSPLSPTAASDTASDVSSPSRVDRSGESCHQCKTRRLPSDLIYCSARHLKKGRARKKKKERLCRKKYCARCLLKFYNEEAPAVNGPESGWVCPGCRGVCSCAACTRHALKREAREKKLALKGPKGKRRGGGRGSGGVEKASEAKVVREASMDGNTAMAAPVAPLATGATKALPVSVAVPADSQAAAPSMAINLDPALAVPGTVMAPPAPMQPYSHTRRSPRLSQRGLPPSADVVSLGPVQSLGGYVPPSSSSPAHMSSFASPSSSYPSSSFTFNPNDMSLSTSPSYYPTQPPTTFQPSPLLPPHFLSSPSHNSLSSPYSSSSGGGGGGVGGQYGFGMSSPLMSPGPGLYRRSPRLSGRLLSENGAGLGEWSRPYGY